jgi:hypothetical protein
MKKVIINMRDLLCKYLKFIPHTPPILTHGDLFLNSIFLSSSPIGEISMAIYSIPPSGTVLINRSLMYINQSPSLLPPSLLEPFSTIHTHLLLISM